MPDNSFKYHSKLNKKNQKNVYKKMMEKNEINWNFEKIANKNKTPTQPFQIKTNPCRLFPNYWMP